MAAANVSEYSNEIETLATKLDQIAKTVVPFYQQYLKPAYEIAYDVFVERGRVKMNLVIREIKRQDDSVAFSAISYGPAFAINQKDTEDTSLHAELRDVTSTIGHMAGAFLVAIHLHMAYLMDVKEILLTNFARDPVRAAQGIYQMFEPDLRHVEEEKETTLANALQQSEGEMYRTVDGLHFKQDLDAYLQWISDRVATMKNNHPWRTSMMGGTKKRKEMNTPSNRSNDSATQRLNNLTPLLPPLPPNNNATQPFATPVASRRSQRFRSAVSLPSQIATPLPSVSSAASSSSSSSSSSSFLSPLPWSLSPSPMPARPNNMNINHNRTGQVLYYDSDSNNIDLAQNRIYVAPSTSTPARPVRPIRAARPSDSSSLVHNTRPVPYSLSSASPAPASKGGNGRHKKTNRKVETTTTMHHRPRRRTYRVRKNQTRKALRNRGRALRTRRRGGACGSCMMGSQPSF